MLSLQVDKLRNSAHDAEIELLLRDGNDKVVATINIREEVKIDTPAGDAHYEVTVDVTRKRKGITVNTWTPQRVAEGGPDEDS